MIINFKKAKEKIKEKKNWTDKKYFAPLKEEVKEETLKVFNRVSKSK